VGWVAIGPGAYARPSEHSLSKFLSTRINFDDSDLYYPRYREGAAAAANFSAK
jgi:hypothetical protein